eukprot:GHVO01039358.1.p1 GENE.GHVO01039358.1~~GHVO01039358.1.p1  ORF type:complete len:268 (-),score=53.19 GHVO01039358.1:85-888(-)
MSKSEKKALYFEKLENLCANYPKVLIVHADHVGSKQMAEVRKSLRGKAVIVMGKNTLIRKALKTCQPRIPEVEKLIPLVKLNVGLVFCIADAEEVRSIITANKVPAAARMGVFAPVDVHVQSGGTGLDPSQTNFFQALGISTKIVKGAIEIQNEVHLIKEGDKVTASQAVLLQKLNILPFAYGLIVQSVYDAGSVYDVAVLDITNEDILKKMATGLQQVAALSRQIGYPTKASVSHSFMESFKHCVALSLGVDYSFERMEKIKEQLA